MQLAQQQCHTGDTGHARTDEPEPRRHIQRESSATDMRRTPELHDPEQGDTAQPQAECAATQQGESRLRVVHHLSLRIYADSVSR